MYKISICAIIKDEKDLKEWIAYHKVIGFDHFYIYDNNENPIELNYNFCTHIKFPGKNQQINAYKDFIKNYAKETEYVCLIDADEYVVFKEKYKSVKEIIEEFPEDLDALMLNWKLFANKEEKRNAGLVFDIIRTKQQHISSRGYKQKVSISEFDKNIKTIAKTSTIHDVPNPHHFVHNKNAQVYCGDLINKHPRSFSEKNDLIKNSIYHLETDPLIWVNHYYIKSIEEFRIKCEIRGRADISSKKNYQKELAKINKLINDSNEILVWKQKVLDMMENL